MPPLIAALVFTGGRIICTNHKKVSKDELEVFCGHSTKVIDEFYDIAWKEAKKEFERLTAHL